MEKTATRLELAAEVAEDMAERGKEDLKPLYLLKPREVSQAAQRQATSMQQSPQYNLAYMEGRDYATHYEASLQLHRLTGGGPKTAEGESGPVATAFNPNRHVVMINGRPIMALGENGSIYTIELAAIRRTARPSAMRLLCLAVVSFFFCRYRWSIADTTRFQLRQTQILDFNVLDSLLSSQICNVVFLLNVVGRAECVCSSSLLATVPTHSHLPTVLSPLPPSLSPSLPVKMSFSICFLPVISLSLSPPFVFFFLSASLPHTILSGSLPRLFPSPLTP